MSSLKVRIRQIQTSQEQDKDKGAMADVEGMDKVVCRGVRSMSDAANDDLHRYT
jgi:hypothetical protein